ncbi:hypothetical protein WJX72_011702 [[Myrmecia] bisecta]|uniref:RAE1/2 domain-containing protein n=1 Tax=[Myrmecia] bisecta TaxID=41462 RepID=A0AAW1QGL3_9CHLO
MGEIQPTEFDLIVVGTGFQEALIAGCAAKAGKTVLHLDQADYYGSHWASLSLDQFLQWAAQASSNSREQATVTPAPNDTPVVSSAPSTPVEGGSQQQTAATKEPAPEQPDGRAGAQDNADAQYATLPTSAAKDQTFAPVGSALSSGLYSNFSLERAAGADLDASRDYNIDLAPKVVYCCGPMIDLLLSCGAQNYLEFKLVQGSYMWREGKLRQVPCSRADVFKDRSLGPLDKRLLMRFLKNAGRRCIAIKTGPGQVLKCKALAAHADVLSGLLPGSASQAGSRVSRALCILDGSLQEGESSVMVAIPPRALGGSNPHAIRVLQLGAPTLVAPSNRYLLHLSTPSAAVTAAEDLRQAVETLVQPPPRALNPDNHPDTASSSGASPLTSLRPKALLVAYYKQSMPSLASLDQLPANVTCCSGPDHTAEIGSAVKGAAALYARLFPGDPDMLSQGALGTNAGDESDDEAVEALEGVLQGLSTRTGGSANGTTD